MFKIGDKLTKENYTQGAIWCNKNNCTINSNWVIEAVVVPEQTREDIEKIRRQLYIAEVDPITAHINRLRDEEATTNELEAEIAKLIEERKQLVEEIKASNPYPAEPIVDTVNDTVNVTEEPLVELAEGSDNEVVELYSMEI